MVKDRAFLDAAIGDAVTGGARRVLIAGSADHGLLQVASENFDANGQVAEFTVLDRCKTPLIVCEDFGRSLSHSVSTVVGDALSFSGGTFDLIIAHNFLNFFRPEERERLVANWAQQLAAGGRVILVSTLKPDTPERSRRFSPSETEELSDRMCAELRNSSLTEVIEADKLRALLNEFSTRRVSHNVHSAEHVISLFESAGLTLAQPPQFTIEPDRPLRQRAGFVAIRGDALS
ncbi:MAG: class I SAM-dependent methyltransferase [Rhodobacteraceae bacterium]|nr:class I SAM-dependent methyltransferase [Paracoccaceae bacterium]